MADFEVDPNPQPTPEQLERIVTLGMTLAKDSGTIRRSRKPNAHVFLPAWVEQPTDVRGYDTSVHWVAGHVGKIGYKAYKLWLREGLSLLSTEPAVVTGPSGVEEEIDLSNHESSHMSIYSFVWTNRSVLDATRNYRHYRRQGRNLVVERMRRDGREQSALVAGSVNVVDLARRREEVTLADCDRLIDNLRSLSEPAQRAA